MRLIFLFLDGVGLAPASEHNPLSTCAMPRLRQLFGGGLTIETATVVQERKLLLPIDARLGVKGEGQSGTGQFSIYTSENGARLFGRHHGPHLPSTLKTALAEKNIFSVLRQTGQTFYYANAYPKRYIEMCLKVRGEGKIRSSVLFEAAAMEHLEFNSAEAVKKGEAISGDLISRWWRMNTEDGDIDVPEILPEVAADNLLRLSTQYDAVFYEFFLTDLAGHRRISTPTCEILARLDAFIGRLSDVLLTDTAFADTLLVSTSDHGNLEDDLSTHHTANPVPLLAVGKNAGALQSVNSIDGVMQTVVSLFDKPPENPNA